MTDVDWSLVATFSSVTRQHILQAIEEYDTRGSEDFLEVYGFTHTAGYAIVHEAHDYDVKAVLGVAHRVATGRLATPDDFHGMEDAVALLRRRGFDVTEPTRTVLEPVSTRRANAPRAVAPRAGAPRTATTARPTRRVAESDRPVKVCPTCQTVLPGTGICDFCG